MYNIRTEKQIKFLYEKYIIILLLISKKIKKFYMQKAQNNENKENTMKRVYTYQDLIKFSGTEIYSAFGEMRTSDKPSAPHFSFGTSTRDAEVKKFTTKEMAVIDCFGKSTSQGLKYDPTDKYQYEEAPKWKFGSAVRNTIDSKIKYQHYDRVDLDTDIVQADKVRRNNNGNTRIGVESRVIYINDISFLLKRNCSKLHLDHNTILSYLWKSRIHLNSVCMREDLSKVLIHSSSQTPHHQLLVLDLTILKTQQKLAKWRILQCGLFQRVPNYKQSRKNGK